jgi:hypothetical protein
MTNETAAESAISSDALIPSPLDIRESIVRCVDEYCVRHGTTRTVVGLKATRDPAIVGRIERGEQNLTLMTIERLRDFLAGRRPKLGVSSTRKRLARRKPTRQ